MFLYPKQYLDLIVCKQVRSLMSGRKGKGASVGRLLSYATSGGPKKPNYPLDDRSLYQCGGPKRRSHPRVSLAWVIVLLAVILPATAQSADNQNPPAQIFVTSDVCLACHNNLVTESGLDVSIGSNWQSSLMAHSSRDPYWQASVRRETLAHPSAKDSIEDECSACHMPMARYGSKIRNRHGSVFVYLPILPARGAASQLAADGVSCAMCHQIREDKLGSEESFTAGFVVDSTTPLGRRPIFGPYDIDRGRSRIMQSASRMEPTMGSHVQDSTLCASCHTLYTHTRGPDGEVLGTLPEQVPYLEWKHSAYEGSDSCQSCHMPLLTDKMHISSVMGQLRENFSRHVFRGGNFFMPKIFNRYRNELGVSALSQDLTLASKETENHLKTKTARIAFAHVENSSDTLTADVTVTNLAGHKLPTAYPSRRAWIRFKVSDAQGRTVFESGRVNPNGSIRGNINDEDAERFEKHHDQIHSTDQVQIYEAIMATPDGHVTTGLIEAIRFIKDNRILPKGFEKTTAAADVMVHGQAADDANFKGAGDTIRYRILVDPNRGPFNIRAELMYQPIAFRWAQNLKLEQAKEIDRFVAYYNAMSGQSWTVLASASTIVR